MTRRGLLISAVTASLFIVAGTAGNTWWLVNHRPSPELMLLSFAAQALAVIGIVWWVGVQAEQRLLRPLRRLAEHVKLMRHADGDPRPQLPDHHALGELAKQVEQLGLDLLHARRDTTQALDSATARIERRTARLEAVLRDLAEGVVVCSLEHRIVLFNQSAAQALGRAGPVGLHRDCRPFFVGDALDTQLSKLLNAYEQHGRSEVRGFVLHLHGSENPIDARLGLVIEPNKKCSGYVLSFFTGQNTLQGKQSVAPSVMSERPAFYDFSILERTSPPGADRPLDELTYVVLDTETTGLNPSSGDEIVQLSAVRVVNGQVISSDQFDQLVNPGFTIPPQSIRFHGISDDMVANAPHICSVLQEFHKYCEEAILVAHNAAFDMKFLSLKEQACGKTFDHPVLDTLLLSIVLQPNHTDHTLDAIAMRFGIHIPAEVRHTALGDALATAEVFVQMLDALRNEDIYTLQQALNASNQVVEIKRLQEKF